MTPMAISVSNIHGAVTLIRHVFNTSNQTRVQYGARHVLNTLYFAAPRRSI
jgi:hypothetical protein